MRYKKRDKKVAPKEVAAYLGSLPEDLDPKQGIIIAEACVGYLLEHSEFLTKKSAKKLKKTVVKKVAID